MDDSASAATKGAARNWRRRSCTPPRFSSTLPSDHRTRTQWSEALFEAGKMATTRSDVRTLVTYKKFHPLVVTNLIDRCIVSSMSVAFDVVPEAKGLRGGAKMSADASASIVSSQNYGWALEDMLRELLQTGVAPAGEDQP
jgi:hypothetical protein